MKQRTCRTCRKEKKCPDSKWLSWCSRWCSRYGLWILAAVIVLLVVLLTGCAVSIAQRNAEIAALPPSRPRVVGYVQAEYIEQPMFYAQYTLWVSTGYTMHVETVRVPMDIGIDGNACDYGAIATTEKTATPINDNWYAISEGE